MTGGRIIGWGTALPEKVLTNAELSTMMDTNDEWITERTGIKRRHVGGSTATLSIESARRAIAMSGIEPASIDGLVLSTTTLLGGWTWVLASSFLLVSLHAANLAMHAIATAAAALARAASGPRARRPSRAPAGSSAVGRTASRSSC